MQRAKDERKLLNKSFNETIDALVRNYDRIDPINSSPNKQRIYTKKKKKTKKHNHKTQQQTQIKHYFPWSGGPEELTQDINKFIINEAKKYWQSFYNLMKLQNDHVDDDNNDNNNNLEKKKKFKSLKQMIARKKIVLTHANHVSPTEMEGIVWHVGAHCHKVETLDISLLQNLTTDAVRILCVGHFGKSVRRLIAKRCLSLHGTTMKLIASRLKPLLYCDLSECINLKDEDMRSLMAHSSNSLKYLCISKTKLGSTAILAVAGEVTVGQMKTPMKHLESFDLSYCKRIKTKSLVTLGKAVHTLQFLSK